uniref:Uncharacterized protein n=1 Tax=Cacopsylla melanoneura TaxID=428564 RepID=A0A8D8S1A6_9HEMI
MFAVYERVKQSCEGGLLFSRTCFVCFFFYKTCRFRCTSAPKKNRVGTPKLTNYFDSSKFFGYGLGECIVIPFSIKLTVWAREDFKKCQKPVLREKPVFLAKTTS